MRKENSMIMQLIQEKTKKINKKNLQTKSENQFCERDDEYIINFNLFQMKHDDVSKDENMLKWNALKDSESIN